MLTRLAALVVTILFVACAQQPAAPAPAPAEAASGPSPLFPLPEAKVKTSAEVLAAAKPEDWRTLDPENTLYAEFPKGRVVIELAPSYAPNHVANIKTLAREKYFDNLAVVRSQDNYVVQWGDPTEEDSKRKPMKAGKSSLLPEFSRIISPEVPFTKLADGDVYAPEVGHSGGFPAARDTKSGQTWLTHCYGMVGAGRGNTADSGSGAELYVVIGHAPRHLDKNITLVGRVVKGMEVLATMPRGTGPLGFYEKASERVPLRSIRVAADVPEAQRTNLAMLRTDTPTFADWVQSRRYRSEEWFLDKVGHVEVCNVPLPVRELKPEGAAKEAPAKGPAAKKAPGKKARKK